MREVELFLQADQQFNRLVSQIKPDQWTAPTPATEWSVRDLVNHITADELWVPNVLGGETIEAVGNRYDGDVLGEDPGKTWTEAAQHAEAAVKKVTDLGRVVHLSYGDFSAQVYLGHCIIDRVIHAWDLARGLGVDDRLEPTLVQAAWEYFEPQAEEWRGVGILGPAVPVSSDADAQTKLLALSGRDPKVSLR